MRTVTQTIYTFSELSETAKQYAIEQHRNKGYDNSHYFDEITNSVKAAADIFGLKFGREYTDLRFSHIDDNLLELSGVRLYKWIINNHYSDLFKRKYYGSFGDNKPFIHPCVKVNRYDTKKGARVSSSNFYYSRIQFTDGGVLTGVCYDDDILKPIYDFLKKPSSNTTLEDLFKEMESAIEQTYRECEEWINSDEFIADELEANGYEFTEEGETF